MIHWSFLSFISIVNFCMFENTVLILQQLYQLGELINNQPLYFKNFLGRLKATLRFCCYHNNVFILGEVKGKNVETIKK